jgi:hypothetical protein
MAQHCRKFWAQLSAHIYMLAGALSDFMEANQQLPGNLFVLKHMGETKRCMGDLHSACSGEGRLPALLPALLLLVRSSQRCPGPFVPDYCKAGHQ